MARGDGFVRGSDCGCGDGIGGRGLVAEVETARRMGGVVGATTRGASGGEEVIHHLIWKYPKDFFRFEKEKLGLRMKGKSKSFAYTQLIT